MRRFAIGLFLILHGLAHSAFGMAAQDLPGRAGYALSGPPRMWLATILFLAATPGFMAAGLGHWGVVGLAPYRRPITHSAVAASVGLLVLFPRGVATTAIGLLIDAAVAFLTLGVSVSLPGRAATKGATS